MILLWSCQEREREEREHLSVVPPCGEDIRRNVSKKRKEYHGNASSIKHFLMPIKSPLVKYGENKPMICNTENFQRKIGMVNTEQCTSGLVTENQQTKISFANMRSKVETPGAINNNYD